MRQRLKPRPLRRPSAPLSDPGPGPRRLRILYLHQHFSTPAGATGTRSFAMADALARRGHDVTLACGRYAGAVSGLGGPFRRGRRQGQVAGFTVREWDIPCGNAQSLARRGVAFLHYAARATGLAVFGRFDVVVASSTPLTVVLPALTARVLAGTPFLFEIRDPWPELPRAMGEGSRPLWAAMGALATLACRRAAAVVALSEGMAATALARGAAAERIAVVPNGCDLGLFGPNALPWRPAAAAAGEAIAVYAGAHGRANGLDALLDAAAWLQARDERSVRLVLVGEGAEKPRLRARAAAEGLANVTFLDPLPKRALAQLLAGSQVGVQCLAAIPAFAEWTAPNKLMDYLAAGLPVVSNLPGRAARLLAEGPCGVPVPPGDAAALGAALAALAADPGHRAALGAAGRAQAERRWDRRRLSARFCAVVEAAARRAPLAQHAWNSQAA